MSGVVACQSDGYYGNMRSIVTRLLGDKGERAAAKYLRKQGMKILARQSKNRIGEIDIIALDGDCIVFVEVKTRSSTNNGQPFEAVNPSKQAKLTRLALVWLKQNNRLNSSARFDVVSVIWPPDAKRPTINHYKNAFEAVGRGQMFC